jgi:glycosyltransferase involved in cell wall biosynthesis
MASVVKPYCPPETPIDVVHGGIHLERFRPGEKPPYLMQRLRLEPTNKVIFSPRLMRPLSNIDKIGEAFRIVLDSLPEAVLVIAAPAAERDEMYENAVRAIIHGYSGLDRTRFIGPVPHDEIADNFRLADVTISIPDIDGTPMTVLESMACCTPTVIGNLPDYDPEYFENEKTTLMVEVKDPGSIADAILRYLTDGEFAHHITQEARQRVEETGAYEYQMGRMEEIYRRVLQK